MKQYSRVIVPVSKEELDALRKLAQLECRAPKEQLRYLLRRELGFTDTFILENEKDDATAYQAKSDALLPVTQ